MGSHTLACKNTCSLALLEQDVAIRGCVRCREAKWGLIYNSFSGQLNGLVWVYLPAPTRLSFSRAGSGSFSSRYYHALAESLDLRRDLINVPYNKLTFLSAFPEIACPQWPFWMQSVNFKIFCGESTSNSATNAWNKRGAECPGCLKKYPREGGGGMMGRRDSSSNPLFLGMLLLS